jgi:hypothetical protein
MSLYISAVAFCLMKEVYLDTSISGRFICSGLVDDLMRLPCVCKELFVVFTAVSTTTTGALSIFCFKSASTTYALSMPPYSSRFAVPLSFSSNPCTRFSLGSIRYISEAIFDAIPNTLAASLERPKALSL